MLYTLLGGFSGLFISYFLCVITGVDMRHSRYAPSMAFFIVSIGTLLGAGIGMGYGGSLLMSGNYPIRLPTICWN